ncbi:nuclear transport factor 2 family protein [Flavisphingomonas formosensis]|uniref:nuclear transport factor 2 family protein n=1 Tax=Flavisphingomonas formosensis TaxID=861534 RepID=UPI0012FC1FF2|nr:nuclear transport factor 2 family protein [Sphingomonas formosensis]
MSDTDVVGGFFKAFGEGDAAGAFALLAPDIRWTYHGPSEVIPFAGTFEGPAGVQRFFESFGAAAEPIEMAPRSMAAADGLVYVRGIERSRIKATGKEYAVEWVHVIAVKDGLIASFDEYLDTAAVAAALA